MARIDDLLERQARDMARLEAAEVGRLLAAYDDAANDLRRRLAIVGPGSETFTAQHLRMALVQVDAGIVDLRSRMMLSLTASEMAAHQLGTRHLLDVIRMQEEGFRDVGGLIQTDIIRRLAEEQALLLHQYSIKRYGAQLVEEIQRKLVAGVAAQKTLDGMIDDIVSTDRGLFARRRYRAELIARMEINRAYNVAHQVGMEELEDDIGTDDDPLLKMASEFFDSRNHPFSRALHGLTASVRGEWFVSQSAVAAAAATMKKAHTGGIVWRRTATGWRGSIYPAHFNDRGRSVPFRKSWEQPAGQQ